MTYYYVVLAAVLLLAITNFATLLWVLNLQRRLRVRGPVPADVPAESTEPQLVQVAKNLELRADQELSAAIESSIESFNRAINRASREVSEDVHERIRGNLAAGAQALNETLDQLRQTMAQDTAGIHQVLEEQGEALKHEAESRVQAEVEQRLARIDEKLSDILAAYIIESLGEQVDLGSQLPYIVQTLEQHKDDIKRDIGG
jgi:hypothetical protein